MPKNKTPSPRKSGEKSLNASEEKQDVLIQRLCDLAIDLVEQEDREAMPDALLEKQDEIRKLIRKCIYQKKDTVLYEAIERVQYADSDAWQFLKMSIEDASAAITVRRDEGELEVNAFVIPLLAHTTGGLRREQCFQDQEAFELLIGSIKSAQLESPDSTVVLVNHAYHLAEIDGITYSHLNEMVLDALHSMTDKKLTATPAIARSMAGWPETYFEPTDMAVELRFLLGFALKKTGDDFYRLPKDEAGMEAHFIKRATRFQEWTLQSALLVKRCLAADPAAIDVNFLYQDLFHGGKESGIAEYFMLQMMSELNLDLDEHGVMPEDTGAVVGPADVGDEMVLRVNLYASRDGVLLASSDKPLGVTRDMQLEVADTYDALMTIGVKAVSLAMRFDAEGKPVDVRPYDPDE
ncbi:hypothetical protein BH11PSE11_BH11PSE11_07390 [soil metagenome]